MKLGELVHEKGIVILEHNTKREALLEMVDVLAACAGTITPEELGTAVFYREQLMSTGLGLGLAVPHVRLKQVDRLMVAMGLCREGINDYETIDDAPIQIIVMIAAGCNQHREYLGALSSILSTLKQADVRKQLLDCASLEEVRDVMESADA